VVGRVSGVAEVRSLCRAGENFFGLEEVVRSVLAWGRRSSAFVGRSELVARSEVPSNPRVSANRLARSCERALFFSRLRGELAVFPNPDLPDLAKAGFSDLAYAGLPVFGVRSSESEEVRGAGARAAAPLR